LESHNVLQSLVTRIGLLEAGLFKFRESALYYEQTDNSNIGEVGLGSNRSNTHEIGKPRRTVIAFHDNCCGENNTEHDGLGVCFERLISCHGLLSMGGVVCVIDKM
jgi:hypothetical protein